MKDENSLAGMDDLFGASIKRSSGIHFIHSERGANWISINPTYNMVLLKDVECERSGVIYLELRLTKVNYFNIT